MFKSILVPTDGSALAEKVFGPAIETARLNGGKVFGISVARPFTHPRPTEGSSILDFSKQYEQDSLRQARERVQKLADAALEQGVPCETITPFSTDPSDEIIAAARKFGCDVIFIASHGRRGISSIFLGSETQRVLADAPVPVLVFR